jgi:hypothetical protein
MEVLAILWGTPANTLGGHDQAKPANPRLRQLRHAQYLWAQQQRLQNPDGFGYPPTLHPAVQLLLPLVPQPPLLLLAAKRLLHLYRCLSRPLSSAAQLPPLLQQVLKPASPR